MASSREIEHTAAAWLARRDTGVWSEQDQIKLDTWLDAATAHRIAFIRLDAAWQQTDRLKVLQAGQPYAAMPARGISISPEFDASRVPTVEPVEQHLPAETRQRPATVFQAPASASARRGAPTATRRRQRRHLAIAASGIVLCVAFMLSWRHYGAVDRSVFQTMIGDLQQVPLADGSNATLSSDSRIVVTLSHGERHVDLQRGEAFFAVAKDPGRPFVVSAGERRVTAVGTRFAVRRNADGLRVVVTQGVVRLESESHPGSPRQPTTLLPAGSVALASDAGIVVHADSVQEAEEYLSWRSGFVSFHDTPLIAAANEFNRYNARKLVIGDASIGTMRIGGNFRWSNVDAFVRLLQQGFPIRAEHRADSIVLRHR
ncbi:MAG TPA: FecR domain-containing protein [Rhodanobacter sp.]|nr:FecR domain-containing protein [Rhodanobacter sp.]